MKLPPGFPGRRQSARSTREQLSQRQPVQTRQVRTCSRWPIHPSRCGAGHLSYGRRRHREAFPAGWIAGHDRRLVLRCDQADHRYTRSGIRRRLRKWCVADCRGSCGNAGLDHFRLPHGLAVERTQGRHVGIGGPQTWAPRFRRQTDRWRPGVMSRENRDGALAIVPCPRRQAVHGHLTRLKWPRYSGRPGDRTSTRDHGKPATCTPGQ